MNTLNMIGGASLIMPKITEQERLRELFDFWTKASPQNVILVTVAKKRGEPAASAVFSDFSKAEAWAIGTRGYRLGAGVDFIKTTVDYPETHDTATMEDKIFEKRMLDEHGMTKEQFDQLRGVFDK